MLSFCHNLNLWPTTSHLHSGWKGAKVEFSFTLPAPKSLVCNCLLSFIVTNNGETNGNKHWMPSQ